MCSYLGVPLDAEWGSRGRLFLSLPNAYFLSPYRNFRVFQALKAVDFQRPTHRMSMKMTSVKLPGSLHQQVLENIVKNGYGLRGKSRWVVEAVSSFLGLSNYQELVDIATEELGLLHETICVRLPDEIDREIDSVIISVRKQYPDMEGVRSNIIRASIMQK